MDTEVPKTENKNKTSSESGENSSAGQNKNLQVVCFNCGEIGHFSSACSKPRICFICQSMEHVAEFCLAWKQPHTTGQYYGSACTGLGFYHIDVEPRDNRFKHWAGMDNFGVVAIEEGIMDENGILENLKVLFDKDWNWQLRKTEDNMYIVRFPPHKKVENLIIGKKSLFNLNKARVVASLRAWDGDVEPIGTLVDVWVQISGIPPKWVDWSTMREVASSLGIMTEVDWHTIFDSFFSMVRVKIQCKDPTNIPSRRLFVFKQQIYVIHFKPEGYEQIDKNEGGGNDNDDGIEELDNEDEDLLDEDPKEKDPPLESGHGEESGKGPGNSQNMSRKHASGSSARRVLSFSDVVLGKKTETLDCLQMLQAMEINVSDDEETEEQEDSGAVQMTQEDEETIHLPEEWVFELQNKSQSPNKQMKVAEYVIR